MAKVRGPLASLTAAGRIGPDLAYRGSPGGPTVQAIGPPTSLPSPAQLTAQQRVATAAALWKSTVWTAQDKLWWAVEARMLGRMVSPYNAHLSSAIAGLKTGQPYTPIRIESLRNIVPGQIDVSVWKDTLPGPNLRLERSMGPFGPWTTTTTVQNGGTVWRLTFTGAVVGQRYWLRAKWPVASANSGRTALMYFDCVL